MKSLVSALLAGAAIVVAAPAFAASDVVTIYSADGLHDGKGSWFETQFDAFTKATGVKVQYVEAGSGGVDERVAKEKSNPQADVLVTLPPFIQRAEAEGLLQKFKPTAAAQIDGGDDSYQPLVNNFQNFIYDSAKLDAAPKTFADLLDLDEKRPEMKGIIEELKEREFRGYEYEAAHASLKLLIAQRLGKRRDFFEVEGYRVIIERHGDELWAEATVKITHSNRPHPTERAVNSGSNVSAGTDGW